MGTERMGGMSPDGSCLVPWADIGPMKPTAPSPPTSFLAYPVLRNTCTFWFLAGRSDLHTTTHTPEVAGEGPVLRPSC